MIRVVVLLVGIMALAAGCAYNTTSRTAKDIKSVAVPFFENRTAEPNLEIIVTEQVVNFLVADNTLKVVDMDDADAVLEGAIIRFQRSPFSFNAEFNAQEYRLIISVRATLFKKGSNESIWASQVLTGDASYFIDAVEGGFTFNEALEIAVEQITERMLNLTVRDW